ncbi:MAG: hypothetical protein IT427_13640 [Pirellulales bacterium]|nr:hypothetical protein [Pirellulales bacterium]
MERPVSEEVERTVRRGWLWAAVVGIALTISGCNLPNWRGGNFRDDLAKWGEEEHRPGTPTPLWGASEQARQVERNLGAD